MLKKSFVFIGGGSVGPVLLIYLAKFIQQKNIKLKGYTFHLIDPHGFCNGGIAYGKCHEAQILNTLPNEMSPWEKDGFYKYVCSLGRDANARTFHSRRDYKAYLETEFNNAKQILTNQGVTIVEHKKMVTITKGEHNTFTIVDEHTSVFDPVLTNLSAEQIIVSVGYGPNKKFQKLWNQPHYIHSIYPDTKLQTITANKKTPIKIAAFGSAAGLYDLLYALPHNPEDVHVSVFSSASKEMEIRDVDNEHTLKDLRLEKLQAISATASVADITNAITYEFAYAREIQAGPDTWTAFRIMKILSNILVKVDESVAKDFRKSETFKYVKRMGNPTSKRSAQVLKRYQPKFIASSIREEHIEKNDDHTYTIITDEKKHSVDYIVNLTGHGRHTSMILEDLKKKELAHVNPKLDILATDDTGYRLKGSGIACIGPATHFGTDGIESFATYAEKLAHELTQKIASM